jgi:signal transduction histidine kinase
MDLLRETVHSIKPAKDVGLDQIKEIADDFKFCGIEFSVNGDFNDEEPAYLSIFAKNLKESLTNVAKHSDADKVWVLLESRPGYLRMVVKDNGTKKSEGIREGMGLSGMRERLRNVGGNFSFGYEDGFVQVSFITRREKHEDPRI